MKATQRDFGSIAARAAREARIAFFCGPDEAGASAAAAKLVELLKEAGERIDITGADLRGDPARLGDEARSGSLFGGTQHIWVRATGDEAHDAVKSFCDVIDAGEADGASPIMIVATSATDKSRTAKLLESRPDGLVAMFYPPDLRTVSEEVRRMADAAGVKLGGGLAEQIARATNLDVRLAQSEVTKLALYLDAAPHSPRNADEVALEAIGAKTEEDGLMPLVNAVLSGEVRKLPGELRRLRELSLNPVGIALALERRAAQLAQLTARLGLGRDVDQFLTAEQQARRIFSRDRRDLAKQMRQWNAAKLERLVQRLTSLHQNLLANSQSADLLLAQELAEITRFATVRR